MVNQSLSKPSSPTPWTAIVLAAGEGKRMRSRQPKVLHEIGGRSLLGHVMSALKQAGIGELGVVVGPDREDVVKQAHRFQPTAHIFLQKERLGTGHAVLAARALIEGSGGALLVAIGDAPLIRPENFMRLQQALSGNIAVAVLGFHAKNPYGYGRLICKGEQLMAIREQKDASPQEAQIAFCNSGIIALSGEYVLSLLDALTPNNAQKEYYLTDCIALAVERGLECRAVEVDEADVMGINDRVQLAEAEALMQQRLRRQALENGATLIDPASVHFSADTIIGNDVVVEPNVFFGPGVRIGDQVRICAFSHIEGAVLAQGAEVGPFARLRPGADIAEGARIGNFVEVKAARIEAGAKVNHLSYIGDAFIGAGANIGAGTITCNYDGFGKYKTEIGPHAFIGSNSCLVAPVSIGEGAYVGSGSVITQNVAANALALTRAPQVEKTQWASRFREGKQRQKGHSGK